MEIDSSNKDCDKPSPRAHSASDTLGSTIFGVFFISIVILGAIFFICQKMKDAEQERLDTLKSIEAITKKAETEIPVLFAKWSEDEVQKDGDVLHWSGEKSEAIFVESYRRCNNTGEEFAVPCWVIWARTEGGHYFTLDIAVDRADTWTLVTAARHSDRSKGQVVQAALEAGHKDALKRLGIHTTGA